MRALLLTATLLVAATAARADVVVPSSAAVIGAAGVSGLAGTYFHEGAGTTGYSVAKTVALEQSSTATGTFVSTAVNYSGTDSSTITGFLGANATAYQGAAPAAYDLSDAILHLTGYFYVPTAKTIQFSLNHDDAAQFSIGGQVAISGNLGNDTAKATFTAPGYYAVDLIYANTDYHNVGNAYVSLAADGVQLSSANVVQSVVAEPASLAMLGLAVIGGLAIRARRRNVLA